MKIKQALKYNGLDQHVNAPDFRGLTPIHVAVLNRNRDVIIILINNGANLFIEDKKNNMPIDLVLEEGGTDGELYNLIMNKMKEEE